MQTITENLKDSFAEISICLPCLHFDSFYMRKTTSVLSFQIQIPKWIFVVSVSSIKKIQQTSPTFHDLEKREKKICESINELWPTTIPK